METVLATLKDSVVFLTTYGVMLAIGMRFGSRAIVTSTLGIFIAAYAWTLFPYQKALAEVVGTSPLVPIVVFALFTIAASYLLSALFPPHQERPAEHVRKKLTYALAGSIYLMALFYHVLPLGHIVSLGSKLSFFGATNSQFWWFVVSFLMIGLL